MVCRVRKPKNQYPQNNLQNIVMCWGSYRGSKFCAFLVVEILKIRYQNPRVGVGLIKKTLSWKQISCILCSGNLEKLLSKSMYLSQ